MKNELLEKIADILEVEEVSIEDELYSFDEWDSLTGLTVIALADSDYGKTLSNEQIKEFVTVGDLVDFILN